MQVQRNVRNASSNGGALQLLKDYWLVILGLFLVVPFLIRYLKDASTANTVNNQQEQEKLYKSQNDNPVTQLTGLMEITTKTWIHDVARNVAFNLGTSIRTKEVGLFDSAFWNPKGWTENDEKTYNQLKTITIVSSRDAVVKCYYFLTRRNLIDDVKTLLDDEYKAKLPLFK
ncbi:hypothetical protein [Flavobacterium gawalongense]|uniref:Uncharacterized protein n=1 Tax=Flavobacterium gawalongense TaxID=2594432 RepID=A0A553BD68_9FLAO|nr:hypothetical protein [Flavobacterium gawalongense]TRX06199.1 hypothetical protein FNW11_14970 [Flavobacterium gawalongense]TRX06931.1 hypothetical protein FNW10_15330 [Flavobacterium gawalongense]TRX22561.1 hypothetical protein FNW38_15580 [Flavobacterium gawalongense]